MKQRLPLLLNLSLVSGLTILGFNVISPVLPQYALTFSIPVALTGWAISAFALSRLVTNIPAGFLADRFGRKRNMVSGLVMIALSSLVTATANDYSWLIIGRIIQGIGSAFYITAATAWVAQLSAGEYRGRVMSLYSGIIFGSTAFGPVIGGYSAVHYGIHAPFYVYGGFAILGILATIPLKEDTESSEGTKAKVQLKDVPSIFTNTPFLLVNASVFALFFLRGGIRSTLIPLYASINLGLTEDKIGVLLTVAAVVTSACAYPSGWLSDKIGRKIPIMSCLFLTAASVILIPAQKSMDGLLAIMVLYGFASGLQGSIAAWPADVAPKDKLGTAMGVYRVIGDTGMFLGPITVTYLADYSGNATITFIPFLIPAIITVIAGFLMIWAKDPAREKRKMAAEDSLKTAH